MADCKDAVIYVKNLYKHYRRVTALKGVSLCLRRGEAGVLVGPNGSGKTTLLKILLGLSRPDSGEVKVFGYSIDALPQSLRVNIGYMPEKVSLPRYMRVIDYLSIVADAKRCEIDYDLVDSLGLSSKLSYRIKSLSQGFLKRVLMASALLCNPKLLVLDEPYSNVDLNTRIVIDEILGSMLNRRETSILISTHIEPGFVPDKTYLLVSGSIVSVIEKGIANIKYLVKCGNRVIELREPSLVNEYVLNGCEFQGCRVEGLLSLVRKYVQ